MPLNNPITSALLADPEIFQQNRLPFHAHFADQTSPEMPLAVSLDGEWAFHYAENLTAPFSDWDTLTVPGFIQMQSLQKPGQPYGTAPAHQTGAGDRHPDGSHQRLPLSAEGLLAILERIINNVANRHCIVDIRLVFDTQKDVSRFAILFNDR